MAQRPTLEERFWAKVSREGGPDSCWAWLGYRLKGTTPGFTVNEVPRTASQVAYELAVGPIPEGHVIVRQCESPVCVNPAHLKPVPRLVHCREQARNALKKKNAA